MSKKKLASPYPTALTQGLGVYPRVLYCGILLGLEERLEGRILGINLVGKLGALTRRG